MVDKLDIDGISIMITQVKLKDGNTVCKHLHEIFNLPDHSGFLKDIYLSHLFTKKTLRILLNEKITGFMYLKPKYHWDFKLKMVYRHILLYCALQIIFMGGLYLHYDISDIISKLFFLLLLLLFLLFLVFIIIIIEVLFCMALLGIIYLLLLAILFINVCGLWRPFYFLFIQF